jgi:hypothetical protein
MPTLRYNWMSNVVVNNFEKNQLEKKKFGNQTT